MRIFISIVVTTLSLLSLSAQAAKLDVIPHLDLEATSYDYQKILKQYMQLFDQDQVGSQASLDPVLRMGKRNLEWLQVINSTRAEADKLSFSSKATQGGIPIETPKLYNESTVLKSYQDAKKDLPTEMSSVIFSTQPLTDVVPLPVDEYLKWGRKVDGIYQTAVRWLTMKNYLPALEARRARDIRGIYFLRADADRDNKLKNYSNLTPEQQTQIRDWLISMCLNGGRDLGSCQTEVDQSAKKTTLVDFYQKYVADAEATWESYFLIPSGAEFGDVRWSPKDPNLTLIPFEEQATAEMRDFLKINIEDEWKWLSWNLKLDFGAASKDSVKVYWQPNIVPHVPYLGANEIYMDSNAPLSEYNVQWTIRHEFGHVLGFPDCYNEFYDRDSGFIVSYQLDITDLMCSRRGKLSERHFKEMQRVYFTQNNSQQN